MFTCTRQSETHWRFECGDGHQVLVFIIEIIWERVGYLGIRREKKR